MQTLKDWYNFNECIRVLHFGSMHSMEPAKAFEEVKSSIQDPNLKCKYILLRKSVIIKISHKLKFIRYYEAPNVFGAEAIIKNYTLKTRLLRSARNDI